MKMDAIIMAGGEGTRLRSVTGDVPKPMALLAGKPVLEHILALLRANGVRRCCLTLRYRPEAIFGHFGDGRRYGMELCYHVEDRPLGTAGGVKACADFIGGRDVLVISGDAACDFDLRALMREHRSRRPAVTMALYSHPAPLPYGTVLTARDGRVVSFVEKPDWTHVVSDLVNTGIYVLSPEALDFVPEGEPYDFAKDLFPALLAAEKPILGIPMEGYWCDIGSPRAFHQCNLDALDGKLRLFEADGIRAAERMPSEPAQAGPEREGRTELPCRSRARLMRALAGSMMEAGADFDLRDGLTLRHGPDRVRVIPAADRESLLLSAEGPEGEALETQYAALLTMLDREI